MAASLLYRKIVHRILQINDTPESIALGTAVGVFIAMTPTVGIQMVLMIIIGTAIRANRLAGIAMVYISNPFTIVPIYWVDYWVGCGVVRQAPITKARFVETWNQFTAQWDVDGLWRASLHFLREQGTIAWPMIVGGTIIGLLCALPVYPSTLLTVRGYQRRKAHKKSIQSLREVLRLEREQDRASAPGREDVS